MKQVNFANITKNITVLHNKKLSYHITGLISILKLATVHSLL